MSATPSTKAYPLHEGPGDDPQTDGALYEWQSMRSDYRSN